VPLGGDNVRCGNRERTPSTPSRSHVSPTRAPAERTHADRLAPSSPTRPPGARTPSAISPTHRAPALQSPFKAGGVAEFFPKHTTPPTRCYCICQCLDWAVSRVSG